MSENVSQTNGADVDVLRQRLIWLCGIRRYAAIGMILAALSGRYVFGIHLPVHLLAMLALITFLYNRYYLNRAMLLAFKPGIAFQQIHFDVIVLTLALLITGGFLNPFFTFYFFAIILAWIVLTPRESVYITILVAIGFGLQGFASNLNPIDLRLSDEGLLKMGELPFHVVGAPISFVVTTALTAYFVSVIMRDLRKRESEVLAARRQTELELSKLDNILKHVEAGMLVYDRNNRVEWANDRFHAWFGVEGMDVDLACFRIGACAKQYAAAESPLSKKESARYYEMQLPTLSEGVRDFEIVVHGIDDARGERVQVIEMVLDVTEQKKKNERWAQAQKLAAIGQLAAGMAHEINTPLGTISILAQETRDTVKENAHQCSCPNQQEMEESLQTIYDQTRRCKEITQSLLNVSRTPTQTRELCSMNDLVRRSLELIRPRASNVFFEELLEPSVPPIVTGVSEVERALCNLLLNAVDALESNREAPRVRVRTGVENGAIFIRVEDNGAGISREDLPHIFEPFFTTKTVGKGTGLGLYVSYNAVRDLGGRVEIESEPGCGCKATIYLTIEHD